MTIAQGRAAAAEMRDPIIGLPDELIVGLASAYLLEAPALPDCSCCGLAQAIPFETYLRLALKSNPLISPIPEIRVFDQARLRELPIHALMLGKVARALARDCQNV